MKTLVISLVLAVPAIASADKNFTGKAGTWDCSKDGTVNISTGGGTYTFTGTCKTININGGGNKVTAAKVDEINLNGASNTIDTDELGTINIVGANNKVTYKNGNKPAVTTVGAGNSVAKGAGGGGGDKGGGDKGGGDKGGGDKGGGDKGGADGNRAIVDCAKKPTWSTGNGKGRYKFIGACKSIAVGGGENDLYIDSVESLDVGGGANNIYVGAVGTINTGGAGNKIVWKTALKGDKPTLKGQPAKNSIVQVK